jgi:hypothetical protein
MGIKNDFSFFVFSLCNLLVRTKVVTSQYYPIGNLNDFCAGFFFLCLQKYDENKSIEIERNVEISLLRFFF